VKTLSPEHAADVIRAGGIIAYPTEGVFGLGCDPFNAEAVNKLLHLKNRAQSQGLILIAAGVKDLLPLIQPPLTGVMLAQFNHWPAALSVLFPASNKVPPWIKGSHSTVALRVTAHPLANRLCQLWGKPLVSTSANPHGRPPAVDEKAVCRYFADKIDALVTGQVLNPGQTSRIITLDGGTLRP